MTESSIIPIVYIRTFKNSDNCYSSDNAINDLFWGFVGAGVVVNEFGTFTLAKDAILTPCTNEINIILYNLYNRSLDKEKLFLCVIVELACFNKSGWYCYNFYILGETAQWGTNKPARTRFAFHP